MPIADRDAFNAAWRRWYRANAQRKIAWQQRRREEIRSWVAELKASRSCERCGESASACLQFHHRDRATKELDIGQATANGWSRERLRREMAKCDVLCANCHLKLHWDERFSSG